MDITRKELSALSNDWADRSQAVLDELLHSMAAPFIVMPRHHTLIKRSGK